MPRTAGIVSLPLPVEDSSHSSLSSDSIEATSKAGLTGRVYKHRCSDQGDGAQNKHKEQAQRTSTNSKHKKQSQKASTKIKHKQQAKQQRQKHSPVRPYLGVGAPRKAELRKAKLS